MVSRSQNVQVSPVAYMAAEMGVSISAPNSFVNNKALGAGIEDTGKALGTITALKSELKQSLDEQKGGASGPSPSKSGGLGMEIAGVGLSLAIGDVVGAGLGIATAVAKSVSSSGASFVHQGTINFGEKGVQGGELSQSVQSQDLPKGGYVDVMGGAWDSQSGAAIKVSSAVAPQPMPTNKLEAAVAAAHQMFSRDELEQAVYSASKEEKSLLAAHGGMVRRAEKLGMDPDQSKGLADYNDFNQDLKQSRPKPLKAFNVGMGAPSAPGLG